MNNSIKLSTLCMAMACASFFLQVTAQNKKTQYDEKTSHSVSCVAFYNLENLFDTINDPIINDEEYLPNGPNKWNTLRYTNKLRNMAYAISQIGTDIVPAGAMILGVSEIENRGVLEDLVKEPALHTRNYKIVHYDSPDRRGVDVGLLYNPDYFNVTDSASYRLVIPENPELRTRDQLLVSGLLQGERVHVIVNHWPSRYGGELYSRPNRNAAARLTRQICDSLYRLDPKAKIIIMGDLNDDPSNESCAIVLGAKKERKDVEPQGYYNTLWKTLDRGIGSLGYNDSWNLFDQIIISGNLANADRKQGWRFWKAEVFNRDFLIVQEGLNKGYPKRTHTSGVWTNGYSDHFPTLIYLIKQK